MKPYNFLIQAALVTVLFIADEASAIQCYQCHGTEGAADYRPLDAAYRAVSTGGIQGNHQTHMDAPASPASCQKCHPGSGSYTSSHRDRKIKVSSRINDSPLTTPYNITTSAFSQTATPTLRSCGKVNCHFESGTPVWGSAVYSSTAKCNQCHEGTVPLTATHAAHKRYSTGLMGKFSSYAACASCHVNYASPPSFRHATSAGQRPIKVSVGGYNSGSLTYLPSQAHGAFGSCSVLYCHSPGNKASGFDAPNQTATWGGSLTCKGCHKSDYASASAITSGSHNMHITGDYNPFGYNLMTCVKCHATTTTAGLLIANVSRHVNGQIEIAFNNTSSAANGSYKGTPATPASPMAKAPGSAYGTCTNVYCHSTGQGANGSWPPTYKTPAWGNGASGSCGTCHGVQFSHSGFSLLTSLRSGSHTKHLQYQMNITYGDSVRCVACHAYTRTGLDPAGCNSNLCHPPVNKNHANYGIDVVIPDYFGATATYNGTTKPGDGYSTCSTVYCHSNGLASSPTYYTATWGTPASGACGTCHGANAAAPPASTRHARHVGSGPYAYACALCHAGVVKHNANSTTYAVISTATTIGSFDGSRLHVNKTRNVKFDVFNPFARYSSYNLSCSSTYCHSLGNTIIPASRLPGAYGGKIYAKPKWTDAGPLACNACHGRSTSNGMPDYTNGKMGSLSSNSHSKHVSSSAIACVECHEKTTKNNTTIRSTFPGKHVNTVSHDVYFNLSGLIPTGTYDNTLRKCSTTYCHGTGASLAWGGTTYCNSCHSAKAGASGGGGINNWGGTPLSAHKLHVEDTTTLPSKYSNYSVGNLSGNSALYRYGCSSCHLPGAGKASHVNGYASSPYRAQVYFGYTSPGKRPSYTFTGGAGTADNGFAWSTGNTVCNQTYCHSNGAGSNGNTAVSWVTIANSATTTRCKTCHSYTTASGSAITTGDHTAHVSGSTYNFSCRKCHVVTTSDGASIADKTKHVNKQINVAFNNTTTAVSGTYNALASPMAKNPGSAYASCTNTYCHSKGTSTTPSSAAPNLTATWGSTLNASCSGCHGNDNSAAYKMGTVGSAAHTKHVQTYSYGCVKCHETTVSTNRTISSYANHVNRRVNIEFNNTTTAVSGTYNGSASPMTKLPGSATGTCTNTYCHSKGTSLTPAAAAPNIVPNWTSNLNATCSSCHGNDSTAAYKMGTVGSAAHTAHVQTYTGFTCDYCHAATVSDSRTISTAANHVNRKVDIDFNVWVNTNATYGGSTLNSKLPGSAMTTCANTYCHSKGTSVSTGTIPNNTTVNWGAAGPLACNGCHGNLTYTADWRKALPLYTTGSPKGNAHARHIRTGSLSGVYMQCFNCHAATTQNNTTIADKTRHVNKGYNVVSAFGGFSSAYRDGDNTMNSTKITLNYGFNASGSSCSNVSCHPIGLNITTIPPTPKTRAASSIKWNSSGVCIDCHNIDMQSTSTYHHAMRNYSAAYPLLAPYSSATNGVNVYARRCTMCHVDHNIFSNDLNSSNAMGRAANLRTDIAVTPTASSGYSNKDYIKSGAGGICISCHTTAKAKDSTRRKNDAPAKATPAITQALYSSSGHQYDVTAKFMSDGSIAYGNCSKCHNALLNETSVFMNATSAYQFGNHNSGIRRLQGALGAAGGETSEEQICFRCHSLTTDADPGGGPPKTVANKDYYAVAPMSLAAQDIFAANLDFRPAGATSTTRNLYFKPTAAESPAEAMPNQHNTGDSFAGGTWIGRSMSPWETTTAYETKSQATNLAGTSYWRMVTFTSPKVNTTTTVPAGNWIINVYCRESSTSQNARIRYMVYKWNDPADTMGATIIAKGTSATELATTSAPGGVRQIAVSVGATTLTAGEKIVVDLSLETTAEYSTSYSASFYFGSHAPSGLMLPGDVKWTYADPGAVGYGHDTQHYTGLHLPSTRNETLAYISQNRHIECVDCHNPHATRNGLHGDYGIATGGSATTLVNSNKQWVPNQWVGAFINIISGTGSGQTRTISSNTATTITVPAWTAPAAGSVYRITTNTNVVSRTQRGVPGASVSYSGAWTNGTYTLVNEATYEYEICFKCHAVTNATTNTLRYWNVTSASLGAARWTNIGLEFNPNNVSYHPVVQALPSVGNRRLTAAALTGGWQPGQVMTCSDCHGRDTSTSATAQGPHGSTVKWLLTGTYQNWPFTSAAANGTAAGGTLIAGTGTATVPSANFCFNCHTWAAGGNAHTKSAGGHNKACVLCHIRVPHGGKMPRLLTSPNAPPRYKPDGIGGGAITLTSGRLPAAGYMGKTDVSCNGCGGHPAQAFPVAGGSYW